MTSQEIDAIVKYLEFSLLEYVRAFEPLVHDQSITNLMYDMAYELVQDIEQTLETQRVIEIFETKINRGPG